MNKLVLLLCTACLASPAIAAPSFSVADVSVNEGAGSAAITITKTGKAISYSQLRIYTSHVTATNGVDYSPIDRVITFGSTQTSQQVLIPIIEDTLVEGPETFKVVIQPVRNASISRSQAIVTIADDDVAPPPTPTPTPTPTPAPTTAWVTGPLTVGGYACSAIQAGHSNVPPCGQGIILKITGQSMSTDAVPILLYSAVFYSDVSGQFPLSDTYATTVVTWWAPTDLIGLTPVP